MALKYKFGAVFVGLALMVSTVAVPVFAQEQVTPNSTPEDVQPNDNAQVDADTSQLKPGMPAPDGAVPSVEINSNQVSPRSATGCNRSVCISVIGDGLVVRRWSTWTGRVPVPKCTFAAYWRNNRVIATSNQVCGPAGSTYYSTWPGTRRFADRDKLCNTWVGIPGKPCITIKR